MKVLITASSRHGATAEIAEAIAKEIRRGGFEVELKPPGDVETLEGYDAVIIGSAVYMTQWTESARALISRFSKELRELPVWAFSCGLAGVPSGDVQDPRRVGPALLQLNAIDHQTFKGRLEFTNLNLRERSIARMGSAPEGDYREWDKIRAWANQIVQDLKEHVQEL